MPVKAAEPLGWTVHSDEAVNRCHVLDLKGAVEAFTWYCLWQYHDLEGFSWGSEARQGSSVKDSENQDGMGEGGRNAKLEVKEDWAGCNTDLETAEEETILEGLTTVEPEEDCQHASRNTPVEDVVPEEDVDEPVEAVEADEGQVDDDVFDSEMDSDGECL
ncbi:hypothetical protein E2C01_034959 [Portunus trituberculatus]|uniref:Uncharacterized protein n=1 Tax=Portunus trituberculatus TaxID=210409 RepID=A0A5B7F1X4_PORTR|nr:hypothetical protein [Portunus trituberculatus]